MNTITIGNLYAYSKDSMIDILHGFGMDDADIETMQMFLGADEIEEAQYEASVWKQEYDALLAHTEALQSAVNDVLNMLDEALEQPRITKAREKMEVMRKIIINA